MSSGYFAIAEFNFSLEKLSFLLEKLNGASSFEWTLDDEIESLSEDLEDGYITILGSNDVEILFSNHAVAISDSASWKRFLYEDWVRKLAIEKCSWVGKCLGVNELIFVPDSTFSGGTPVGLFMEGNKYADVHKWTLENLEEVSGFERFKGDVRHHDVYYASRLK